MTVVLLLGYVAVVAVSYKTAAVILDKAGLL